ncbi:regulator of G-protein signaling 22 isoform X11 [Nannospalax galili]|uniref:regulator of G-protein signaling 22 isoform X11 n=1 Tax=Nannospalax galili TaxID=1026970 RepID=UPI00111C46A5|nr:regulator of G-protein signaling 22 isoform X11 [Nannospalax galili]
MPEKRLSADPPDITEEEFENCLATDDFLVDYFNEFLSLPTFSKAIRFNVDYGVFEVVNDAPQLLEKQLKKILQNQQPRNPIYDVIRKGKSGHTRPVQRNVPCEDEAININYSIMCLNREQGIKWIKKERLPAFLESDCYFEYRLAKLISQVTWSKSGMNFIVGTTFAPWVLRKPPTPPPPTTEDDHLGIMKKFYISLGEASYAQTKDWFTLAKQSQQTVTTFSLPCCIPHHKVASPAISSVSENFIFDDGVHPRTINDLSKTSEITPELEEEGSISIKDTPSQALLRIYLEKQVEEDDRNLTMHFSSLEEFLNAYIIFILREAVEHITGHSFTDNPSNVNFYHIRRAVLDNPMSSASKKVVVPPEKETVKESSEEILEKVSLSSKSESIGPESRANWCMSHRTYDIGNRREFERFKKFLKGTLGEKYWWLWMDIERLKVLKDPGRHQRSNNLSEKNTVVHLTSFTDISECLKPQLDRKYAYTEEPNVKTVSDVGALGGFDMENLLQSLYVENRAGFFFTKFCENSGNKLWKNSVYFWFDLQAYHQLFYQETLQPFKVCKQAQYLFATYVAPSAALDIGLEQERKKEIYMQIQPPFEDLFDTAEEYILLLLLEPWTEMVTVDQVAYRKVELQEETRQLDSTYFRKLQALHKETIFKKTEDTTGTGTGILSLSDVSKQTEYWNNVPEEYKQFSFNDLLNNKLEFEHFRQFLESHSSSIDLMCWTDIEQFRRILFKDRRQREAKSIYIKNKYLNKKYFFGPNSPASLYQQNQIMLLSGGWGKILHEQLDAPVLVEIQKHVLNRLENVWLPLFLASEQFAARQKIKLQMKDIADELLLQKHERKIGVWKPVASKWISSSCEIIAFRKALLNPVTARQFQRFVALKGDLLENGVLFWQEVQKYKDLCHSHCDESIIQKKITTIISCFINSCIPPALQIDIPVEQAQKIIEHRKDLGPYVFREAQMTIFGVLFKFWPQFCEFRKNLTDEKIMSVLERRKEYNKQKKKMSDSDEEKFGKIGPKHYASTTGSITKPALTSDSFLGLQAYGRQPTWCYSKYIEALEQERILLKIQEEMERKMLTGTGSFTNLFKPSTRSTMSLKKNLSLHTMQSQFSSDSNSVSHVLLLTDARISLNQI